MGAKYAGKQRHCSFAILWWRKKEEKGIRTNKAIRTMGARRSRKMRITDLIMTNEMCMGEKEKRPTAESMTMTLQLPWDDPPLLVH